MTVGVVVPCFNEAARWNAAYWKEMVTDVPVFFLFVDDGSTDDTAEKIAIAIDGASGRCLRLSRNQGKAEAVRLGLLELLSDDSVESVGYLDADGAFSISDVVRLQGLSEELFRAGSTDAVWSSRVALAGRDIRRSSRRHYIGRVVATIVSFGQSPMPYDTQSGFKLFRASEALRESIANPFSTRWLFEIELLARWEVMAGSPMKVWEEPLDFWHDVSGSKIKGLEALRISREILRVKLEQYRCKRRNVSGV